MLMEFWVYGVMTWGFRFSFKGLGLTGLLRCLRANSKMFEGILASHSSHAELNVCERDPSN